MKHKKQIFSIVALLLLIGVITYVVLRISPEGLAEYVGEDHAYTLLFLSAFLGGTSVFLPFPYYLFTISFGAAEFSPLLLGIVAALGTGIGDIITYTLARNGRHVVSGKVRKFFDRIFHTLTEKHPRAVPLFTYIYASVVPLSDDFISIPAGLAKYPAMPLIISLMLGKVTFNMFLAYAGLYGWDMVAGYLSF